MNWGDLTYRTVGCRLEVIIVTQADYPHAYIVPRRVDLGASWRFFWVSTRWLKDKA